MSDSGEEPKTCQQEEASQSQQVCTFFKKPSKAKNLRKRPAVDADEEDADAKSETSILNNLKKVAKPDNKLFFSSGPSKGSATTTSEAPEKAVVFHYDSSKEIQVQNDSRATATLETETDFNQDARAIRERVLKRADEALKGNKNKASGEKLYTGIHGYTDHKAGFRREQTISSEKAGGSHGPLRASAHIRVSARFDYQPDICKDYKETGYCGYGDSCKFLHDRGDYKPGWQIEKEWEEAEKVRKRNKAMGVEDEDDDEADSEEDEDALPFACFICRESFVDPVVTKCKHYFCEHCALKHHTKNKKCFVCNQPTMGIFNAAHEIKKRMAEERSKAQGL
ncbi:zinc finger CCCH domain-containing protein 1 [Brassica napus]|nr:zinc finger CCCH domain-containing protein 1 [Brassica napus]